MELYVQDIHLLDFEDLYWSYQIPLGILNIQYSPRTILLRTCLKHPSCNNGVFTETENDLYIIFTI